MTKQFPEEQAIHLTKFTILLALVANVWTQLDFSNKLEKYSNVAQVHASKIRAAVFKAVFGIT